MSNKILNLVRDARLGKSRAVAKEVLRTIADQSNDAGTGVWSSYKYIAWCLERDRSTVIKQAQWLQKKGLLSSTKRTGKTNLWTIHVDELEALGMPYRDKIEAEGEFLTTGGIEPLEGSDLATGVVGLGDPSPSLASTETKEEELPVIEPTREVIDPYGEPLPKKKICQMCEARPKGKNRKLYCDDCGEEVEGWFHTRAVMTYEKREPNYHLSEAQVKMINSAVGDLDKELYRWGRYLDHWLASGWFVGKAGLGNVLKAYIDRKLDNNLAETVRERRTQLVDARPLHSDNYPGADKEN